MDKLGTELTGVLAKLQGPGMDAARRAVQINAMTSLVWGCVGIVIFLTFAGLAIYILMKKPLGTTEGDVALPTFICSVIAIVGFVLMSNLFSPWTWAAFSEPDAVLASKLLNL